MHVHYDAIKHFSLVHLVCVLITGNSNIESDEINTKLTCLKLGYGVSKTVGLGGGGMLFWEDSQSGKAILLRPMRGLRRCVLASVTTFFFFLSEELCKLKS